eukprot:3940368-Rhodomonas_salina.4
MACPVLAEAVTAAHDAIAHTLIESITLNMGEPVITLTTLRMDSINGESFNNGLSAFTDTNSTHTDDSTTACPEEVAALTPDAVLGYLRHGARAVVLVEFTRRCCFTETEEGMDQRDATKTHKYQGACLHLQKTFPGVQVSHMTFVMTWSVYEIINKHHHHHVEEGLKREGERSLENQWSRKLGESPLLLVLGSPQLC